MAAGEPGAEGGDPTRMETGGAGVRSHSVAHLRHHDDGSHLRRPHLFPLRSLIPENHTKTTLALSLTVHLQSIKLE